MNVPFTHERIEQLDIIKAAMITNFKTLGYDFVPHKVTDLTALEYALDFTTEVLRLQMEVQQREGNRV